MFRLTTKSDNVVLTNPEKLEDTPQKDVSHFITAIAKDFSHEETTSVLTVRKDLWNFAKDTTRSDTSSRKLYKFYHLKVQAKLLVSS